MTLFVNDILLLTTSHMFKIRENLNNGHRSKTLICPSFRTNHYLTIPSNLRKNRVRAFVKQTAETHTRPRWLLKRSHKKKKMSTQLGRVQKKLLWTAQLFGGRSLFICAQGTRRINRAPSSTRNERGGHCVA